MADEIITYKFTMETEFDNLEELQGFLAHLPFGLQQDKTQIKITKDTF